MGNIRVIELRLEDYANNNHKFYRVYAWSGGALTQWGRIGTKGQFKLVGPGLGNRKVDEKLSGGYNITTNWLDFEVPPDIMASVVNEITGAYTELDRRANQAIGMRVQAAGSTLPVKTEEEVESEFADKLLGLAGKYRKPEAQAPAAEPKTDPSSIEGRLGAALAAARDAS